MSISTYKIEFGDFQTPSELAAASCRLLVRLKTQPRSILEPTCGVGGFLSASLEVFSDATTVRGFEINSEYVEIAQKSVKEQLPNVDCSVVQADFFQMDWKSVLDSLPSPILVLGNPPWVTNAALGSLNSENLPKKSNFQNVAGIGAVTGKSNFDISESMLIKLCESLHGREATLAMLCKTSVARKLMTYCWKRSIGMGDCHIFPIDAMRYFNAAVEACLFVGTFVARDNSKVCHLHSTFDLDSVESRIGYRDEILVSDVESFERWKFLRGKSGYVWRSGVKHDCSKVMEFKNVEGKLLNGFGEDVVIEDHFLYPLLKSSGVSGSTRAASRKVLVTQKRVGQGTNQIAEIAPKTWQYLVKHAELLDSRVSIIYHNRPRFCVFGVGEYSFAPWKVIISGFYKRLDFRMVGPCDGRPVMLDDTSYFLSCESEPEAAFLVDLLNSAPATDFLSSLIFWDSKRPITVEVLSQLSLEKLAEHLGKGDALVRLSEQRKLASPQADLFSRISIE